MRLKVYLNRRKNVMELLFSFSEGYVDILDFLEELGKDSAWLGTGRSMPLDES
jgi:hypothetical protein